MLNLLPDVTAPEFVEAHTMQMNDQQVFCRKKGKNKLNF
jgi:hypothetical protein